MLFQQHFLLALVFILGVVIPYRWFADGRLIAGGDHGFYYNPPHLFFDYFYLWLDRLNFGEPNFGVANLFPFLAFFKLLQVLGFSPFFSEVLWAIALFLGSGVSMFLLVWHLSPEKLSWRRGGAFVAAVFYMVNPFVMHDLLQISLRPVQAVLPLLLLLWYLGLKMSREQTKYAVLFSLATLLTASTGTAPAYLAIIPLALFGLTVYWCLFHRNQLMVVVIFALKASLLTVVFNLWWLVPAFLAYLESGATLAKTIAVGDFTKATPLWEALRLLGFWAFRSGWGPGVAHIPYAHYYYENFFLVLSYFFTALGLFGVVIRPRRRLHLFFGLLFLLGVFLAKGANPPFGEYYSFLFKNFPPFALFRESFSKFTPLSLFALAVLLGLSWGKLLGRLSFRWRWLLTAFLFLANLLYAFPVVTGQAIQNPSWHGITRDSLHVETPSSWFEAGDWFRQNDPDGRIMLFPRTSYGVCYNWVMGSCASEPVARMFLPNQTIKNVDGVDSPSYNIVGAFHDLILRGRSFNLSAVLSFFGIRYALLQKDIDWRHASREIFTPGEMVTVLESTSSGLKKVAGFETLDVYQPVDYQPYPLIYTTSQLSFVSARGRNFDQLAAFRKIAFPDSFLFTRDEDASSKDFLVPTGAEEMLVFPDKPTLSPNRLDYTVDIPEDGQYRLYLSGRSLANRFAVLEPSSLTLTVDDVYRTQVDVRGSAERGGWVAAGEAFFSSGRYNLTLAVSDDERTAQANYFSRNYTTSAIQPNAVVVTVPPGHYAVSFNYLMPPGVWASFFVKERRCDSATGTEKDCEEKPLFEENLAVNLQPLSYQKEFTVYAPAKDIIFGFGLRRDFDSTEQFRVSPLSLTRLLEARPALVKVPERRVTATASSPVVSFRRRDPTLYEASIVGARAPYYFAFLSSFNRNWKLNIGGQAVPEERHFMINGFANGWFLKPEDASGRMDYTITLEYRYQRFFYASLAVSAGGVLLAIGYLLWRKVYA